MRRSLHAYRRRYDPRGAAGLGRREETRRRAGRRLLLEEETRTRAEERFVPASEDGASMRAASSRTGQGGLRAPHLRFDAERTTPMQRASSHPAGRAPVRWNRVRSVVAAALAAAFAVLLPAAITSAWIRGTILSTSGYVAAVTPVAASPAVRAA